MPHRSPARAGLLLTLVAVLATLPVGAATSFDFLFNLAHVGDDGQYFLNLAVGNAGYGREVIEPILPRLSHVDADLPVVLFAAHASGRPVDFVVDLRSRGMSWNAVFSQCGVPVDTLFAGLDRDPGPPYGKAWGHWKKQPHAVQLRDSEVRDLVQVQLGAHIAGIPPYDLAREHGQGRSVQFVVAEHKGRPYQSGKGKGKSHKEHKGHGPHD